VRRSDLAAMALLLGCESAPTIPVADAAMGGGDATALSDLGARDGGACGSDLECDDGDFCNGAEFCAGAGAPMADPRGCIRRSRSAEERAARCVGAICTDRDGDGHRPIMDNGMMCTGPLADDCDDADPSRYPRASTPNPERRWLGANERCDTRNTQDEDCDPLTIAGPNEGDIDGDGFPNRACCNAIPPFTVSMSTEQLNSLRVQRIGDAMSGAICGRDCDDLNPAINPNAAELPCDGIDNNCDGVIDPGGRGMLYRDCDGDGDGDPMFPVLNACISPPAVLCNGFPGATTNTDCNDRDARILGTARDGGAVPESCDGIDNNCDGRVDNGPSMECAIALPGSPANTRTCVDSNCNSAPGRQTCVDCRWTPAVCARAYDRTVVLNTNNHECEVGQRTSLRCTAPGRTGNCGYVVCNNVCEADPRGACQFDSEVCDYLDQDCNGRVDELLGRSCEQVWNYTNNDFSRDWQFVNAALDPMSGRLVLASGARNRASAAFLPLTIDRARGIEIDMEIDMSRGDTEELGDGISFALVEAPTGSTGVGTPITTVGEQGIPTDLRGYFFRLGYNGLNPTPFLSIQRRDSVAREIQRVDLPLNSVITGDTCGGAGTFVTLNTGFPSRFYRGGGVNRVTITITEQLLSFGVTYNGRPGGCATASGTEPDAAFLGRPMRLAMFTATTAERTLSARVERVTLRRPCITRGGGTCETTPNYCAQSTRCL
jgi:hypothetical protein